VIKLPLIPIIVNCKTQMHGCNIAENCSKDGAFIYYFTWLSIPHGNCCRKEAELVTVDCRRNAHETFVMSSSNKEIIINDTLNDLPDCIKA